MKPSVYINVDSGEKTFVTPRHIVDELGPFDCDPCVPDIMPWRTATTMYTPAEDGLVQPWHGRVWLNPPYGKEARPFLAKMIEHVQNGGSGIALIFVRTDNKAWHELIFPYAKAFLFLKGRIAFCDTQGKRSINSATMPSVLVAYTWHDVDALERARKVLDGFLVIGSRTND
jgi:hypothetical protein